MMSGTAEVQAAQQKNWRMLLWEHRYRLMLGGLLLLPLAVMYATTAGLLLETWWNDPNSSHGLLIPPLAAWFAWRRRGRLGSTVLAPSRAAGMGVVLFGLAMYFVGTLGVEFFLTRLSLLVVGGGLILYFLGRQHLKLVRFPLFLLALAVPIPSLVFNIIAMPLQQLASASSSEFLQVCGVPVLREGNVIHLAATSLGVAEACSGLRSLTSLFALAVILAYLKWGGWLQRLLLVLLAVPLAILLNVLRISGTAVIANYWDLKYAMGFFHVFSGWLVFVLAFVMLFGCAALIQWVLPSPPPAEEKP